MTGGLTHFGKRLLDACGRYANRPALDDGHTHLTYREFAAAALGLSRKPELAELGRGEPVLVAVSGRVADLIGWLAVWYGGGVVVPVHRSAVESSVHDLVRRTGARYLVDADPDARLVTGMEGAAPVLRTGRPPPPADPMLDGAAWIVFTSGSTGEPKGVVHDHSTWSAKLDMIESEIGAHADRVLLALQPTFIFGQWLACLTLITGGVVILRDRFDAASILSDLGGGVTRIGIVPTMLRRLRAAMEVLAPPHFEGDILSGGEPMPPDLADWVRGVWPKARLWDLYGSTEMCACDCFVQPGEWTDAAGTIGRPGLGIDVRTDPATGELLIRSPYGMRGYFRDPARTAAVYHDGWFRTGDVAQIRPDGRVRLLGRIDDMINRGGVKISPLEIERAFQEHPDVGGALA
ncbi:MAG: acyl--CoA ligase, partial [Alphaproteobacteria bacterium]|nr:acyl--CoA ligase [Alphaproteobacteria bacterium]